MGAGSLARRRLLFEVGASFFSTATPFADGPALAGGVVGMVHAGRNAGGTLERSADCIMLLFCSELDVPAPSLRGLAALFQPLRRTIFSAAKPVGGKGGHDAARLDGINARHRAPSAHLLPPRS